MSYVRDHTWHPFVRYLNGLAVRNSNTGLFRVRPLQKFGNQNPTVFRSVIVLIKKIGRVPAMLSDVEVANVGEDVEEVGHLDVQANLGPLIFLANLK